MASLTQTSHIPTHKSLFSSRASSFTSLHSHISYKINNIPNNSFTVTKRRTIMVQATTTEMTSKKKYPGEAKGFVEEMRFVAMKLHTKDQAKEGEKESDAKPIAKWEPSIEGYLKFLVDSKVVYDTLESIVDKASCPWYAEFKNTGLERSDKLAKDLEWFKEQGHVIPEPSSIGLSYASYLEDLSENDPPAFICHFYNVYFAHSAGGRMIGKKRYQSYLVVEGRCYAIWQVMKVPKLKQDPLLEDFMLHQDLSW